MEREALLASIRETFFQMCNVSEDNSASDEFISQHQWARIEDGHWRFNKSKPSHENGFEEETDVAFPKGIELDVYRFTIGSPTEIQPVIREIAKTFHDLEGKTYVFREFENLGSALSEWGASFAILANDQALAHCSTYMVSKVYGDSTTALYLGLGEGGVVAFVFNVLVDVEDPGDHFEEL